LPPSKYTCHPEMLSWKIPSTKRRANHFRRAMRRGIEGTLVRKGSKKHADG
jgi:hypothetical protein